MADDQGYISEMRMFIIPEGGKPILSPSELWQSIWQAIALDKELNDTCHEWNTDDETKLGINVGSNELSFLHPYKRKDGGNRKDLIIAILHEGLVADQVAADQLGEAFGELVKPLIAHQSDLHWTNITIRVDKEDLSPLELSDKHESGE